MSLFLNKNSHSGHNICICSALQRSFARASPRDKAISGNQPIQETRVVCNIVAGVLTLVLACVFTVGWVRSLWMFDFFDFSFSESTIRITSMRSNLAFVHLAAAQSQGTQWSSGILSPVAGLRTDVNGVRQPPDFWEGYEVERRWDFGGGHIGFVHFSSQPNSRMALCSIPYLWISAPLVMLSAYLLISKPGKPKQAVNPQPVA